MKASTGNETTYHVADIGALDQQSARQGSGPFNVLRGPSIGSLGLVDLSLQVAQLLHVVGVDSHVGGKNGADHEFAESFVLERSRPMTAQNLRIGGTVKSFQYRLVVVQLCKRSVQLDQEHIVDSGVTDIVPDGRDKKGQGLEWPE